MPTRQQRRAKQRAPIKKKRRGQAAFIIVLTGILALGVGAAAFFKQNPVQPTRGAIQGEHWHATYQIEVCGKKLPPYPTVEGEIHTHGDGRIHIHPSSPAFTLDNANLGKFFATLETEIGLRDGKQFIRFPSGEAARAWTSVAGQTYVDGGTCPGSKKEHEIAFIANGDRIKGDPGTYVLHEGDKIVVRFGPEASGPAPTPFEPPTGEGGEPPPAAPASTPNATPSR